MPSSRFRARGQCSLPVAAKSSTLTAAALSSSPMRRTTRRSSETTPTSVEPRCTGEHPIEEDQVNVGFLQRSEDRAPVDGFRDLEPFLGQTARDERPDTTFVFGEKQSHFAVA